MRALTRPGVLPPAHHVPRGLHGPECEAGCGGHRGTRVLHSAASPLEPLLFGRNGWPRAPSELRAWLRVEVSRVRGPSLAVPGVLPGSWLLPDCAHVLGPRRVPPQCVTHPPTKCSGLWAESVRGLTVSSACRLDSGKEHRCSFSLALHPWNVVVKASASDRGGGTSSPGLPGHSANPRGFGDSSLPSPRSGDHRSEIEGSAGWLPSECCEGVCSRPLSWLVGASVSPAL